MWALSHSLVSADLIYTASSHKEVHLPAARSLPPYSCLPTQATPTISRRLSLARLFSFPLCRLA